MVPTAAASRVSGVPGASAHLVARLCMPDQVVVPFGGAGPLVVRPRVLEVAESEALRQASLSGERLWLTCAGERSALIVEPALAAAVVSRVLGLGLSVGTPLTRVEKGIVTGAVAALLSQLGLAPVVLVGDGGPSGAAVVSIVFAVDMGGRTGHAWLALTDALLDAVWRRWPGLGGAPAIELELAQTSLSSVELDGAAIGDTVVFDGVAEAGGDTPWPVVMRRGERRAPALWLADGTIVIVAASLPADGAVEGRRTVVSRGPAPAGSATAQVVAVRGPCTAGPAWKSPFELFRDDMVILHARGKPWAHGNVVVRDGSFAVVITALLAA